MIHDETEDVVQPKHLHRHDLALDLSDVREHLAAARRLLDDIQAERDVETARFLAERTSR